MIIPGLVFASSKKSFMETLKEFPLPDKEIISIRDVNAEIPFVFKAWTNPVHLQRWWGPKGFTNTFNDFNISAGGRWSFVMHGPDGTNYVNECVFVEVVEPSLVSFDHLSDPVFRGTASFAALTKGVTRITYTMQFETNEIRDKMEQFITEKNEELFDRLENELIQMKQG